MITGEFLVTPGRDAWRAHCHCLHRAQQQYPAEIHKGYEHVDAVGDDGCPQEAEHIADQQQLFGVDDGEPQGSHQ